MYKYNPNIKRWEGPMCEAKYQYLNSLSLDDYDSVTTEKEQEEFCNYQAKYHPDEQEWFEHFEND